MIFLWSVCNRGDTNLLPLWVCGKDGYWPLLFVPNAFLMGSIYKGKTLSEAKAGVQLRVTKVLSLEQVYEEVDVSLIVSFLAQKT